MLIRITKASDFNYQEDREIESLDDLVKIAHEFKDPNVEWDASLVLHPYNDKPFRFVVQIYDDYIE